MWLSRILFWSTILCAGSGLAQRPNVAPEYANDPRWKLGTSLAEAPISAHFRDNILVELIGEGMPAEMKANVSEYTMVYAYTIPAVQGEAARRVLRVWGGGESCGATGNCPIMIYDAKTQAVLLDENGWDFAFLPTRHAGARDVQVMGKGGACDISKTVLRYNGTHYVTGKSDPVAWCSEGSQ